MKESGYYPPGADTPDAPWNEKEKPLRAFDVCACQTLSKSTEVYADDYTLNAEQDEEGFWFTETDTSDINWRAAYNNYHYTPLELIELFKEFLQKHLPDPIVDLKGYKKYKRLIKECEGWTEDELEIIEE